MPSFWNCINTNLYEPETDRNMLVENRHMLLDQFLQCYPNTEIAVWLTSEKDTSNRFAYLSRIHPLIKKRSHNYTTLPYGNLDPEKIYKCLGELSGFSLDTLEAHRLVSEIGSVRRRGDGDALGFIVASIPKSSGFPIEELNISLSQFSIAYGHMLLDSRHRRIATSLEQLEKILSASIKIEERIERLNSLLCWACGAASAEFISFLGDSSAINLNQRQTLRSLKLDLSYGDLENGPVRHNYENLNHSYHNTSNPPTVDTSGVLVIPILDNARELKQRSLAPISFDDDQKSRPKIVNHAIVIFKRKNSETSYSHFTDTDVELAIRLAGIFQNSLGSYIYERKVSRLSEYFEVDVDEKEITATDLYKVLTNGFLKCSGVSIFEYKLGKDVTIQSSSEDILCEESYVYRMKEYVTQNIDQLNTQSRILLGVDQGYETKIEFFFANELGIARLIVVHLRTKIVSDLDYRLLVYMMSEMRVHFKSADSLQARASELAQIRHAIISPVAACSDILDSFVRLARTYRGKSEKLWAQFKDFEDEWASLQDAVAFAEAAKLLAESGKYLFLEPGDQSINKKPIDLLEVYNLAIKNAHLMNDQKIVIRRTITGKETDHLGHKRVPHADKSLLFLVFLNLLDNALKYTVVKQSYEYYKSQYHNLQGGRQPQGLVAVKLNYAKNVYEFSVQNVGRYIPENERDKIFVPFGRGRQFMDVNPVTGTGIGLPASKKIVKGHFERAEIFLTSKRLPGSNKIALNTFTCSLPYDSTEEYI